MISNTKFFVLGVTPASPYNLQMYKITFLSTPVDWANQIVCALATWSSAVSESILSSDGSTIYSFFTFGSNSIYFAGLSVSNGSVVTSMFKSNTALSGVSGSSMNGDYVVVSTGFSSANYVMFYSISSSTFAIKSFSAGYYLYWIGLEPSSGR